MTRQKKRRFAENILRANLVESGKDLYDEIKGKWHLKVFTDQQPIVLELGCGKGEYTVALAKQHPDCNYIGIDIKGARFWRGAKTALEEKLTNVVFIRTQIELINHVFAENEVSEIWLTFPDPQLKFKRTKHRLTNPDFLAKYQAVLSPKGIVHLKTDSPLLYNFTLKVIEMYGFNDEEDLRKEL